MIKCSSCDRVITGETFVVEAYKGYTKFMHYHLTPQDCADQQPLRKEFHFHGQRRELARLFASKANH